MEIFELNALGEEEWVSARARVKKESILNRGHSVSPGRLAGKVSPTKETWAMRLESSEKQQSEQHENTTHGMGSNISRAYTW